VTRSAVSSKRIYGPWNLYVSTNTTVYASAYGRTNVSV